MHEVLVNRLGGLSLPRKSVVRLTDRPDMTLDVYRGRKTTIQPTNQHWSYAVSLKKTALNSDFVWIFYDFILVGEGAYNSNGVNFEHHRKLLSL